MPTNITLKRKTSSGTEVLYPATIGERILSGTIDKDRLPDDIPVSKLDGTIPASQLPAIAFAETTVHGNTFANFLQTYNDTSGNLEGNVVISTTDGQSYIHNGGTDGDSNDWTLLSTPTADITAVSAGNGLSGGGTTGAVSLAVSFAGTGSANTAARSDHNHDTVYKATFTENSAFNKDFGTAAGTVAQGNHNHDLTYLALSGGTLTGAITVNDNISLIKEGQNSGSRGIVFQGNDDSAVGGGDFSLELRADTARDLTFGGNKVVVIESTNQGRFFYNTTTGTVEGDIIFDVV